MFNQISFIAFLFFAVIANAQTEANISLEPVKGSPEYKNAKLKINNFKGKKSVDSNAVKFEFSVLNYDLMQQTTDAKHKNCANSGKGQHIHLLINGGPYLARYEQTFTENLANGNYVALAFLSRSYHESIKTKSAYQLWQFKVGTSTPDTLIDLKQPMLFFSRPKGTYSVEESKNLLLDFFLVNVKLSENGYKVKATIDGKSFVLTEWKANFIKGLSAGKHVIEIELLDKNNQLVKGDYTSTKRTITIE